MVGSMKLQPNDGPRYSLGIRLSSDDTVGSRRKFTRRFAEGIEKLAGNAKGDHRKEDQRTYRKIAGGERWLDLPYHRIWATTSRCRRVNCPDGG
ncbi:hypothetical protein B296_00048005 [Ensete ventricosum]|uniref:Uncharacterized protein n=1 Tax=Ensete ventricosum TaxID=4639 RepID=A0A426X4J5_ENSVE|nr:hypothetical protein B296_00048005 [Ensete ventricosum]